MKELKILFNSYKEALFLYKKVDFKGKKMIPIAIIIILFALYLFIGDTLSNFLIISLKKQLKVGIFTDNIIHILSRIFTIVVYFYTYKFLALGLFSPFLSVYSEKIEKINQRDYVSPTLWQNIGFIFRGLGISIINFLIELIFTVFFFFLGILLPFKIIFFVATFLIQGFFVGYSFVDYYMERRFFGVKKSLKIAFKSFFSISIIGMSFLLIFAIPVVGILYGPIYFTTVGTLYFLKKEKITEIS